MKRIFKKLAALSAATVIAAGVCAMPVSAEISNKEAISNNETLYEVYPKIFYSETKIKDIQQKLKVKCEEEGLSEENTKAILSLWDLDNFTVSTVSDGTTTKPAKQFFSLCTAKAGTSSFSNNSFNCDFKYNTNSMNYISVSSIRTLDNHTANGAPFLNETLYGETYKKMSWSLINGFLGSIYGDRNIAVFYLNTNNNLSGVSGYEKIANNSEVNISNNVDLREFPLDGYSTWIDYDNYNTANKNVGALGDVFWDEGGIGLIDSYDVRLVSDYVARTKTLNKLQFVAADVIQDDVVDLLDVSQIMSYINPNGITMF